jgi:cobalt-zinc-cadmium efflux system membrane fusion protein
MNKKTLLVALATLALGIAIGSMRTPGPSIDAHADEGSEHADHARAATGDAHAEGEQEEGHLALDAGQIAAAGIQVVQARAQSIDLGLSFPAEVGFDEDRTAHLVPRVPGVVESVAANLGQSVKKGQLLAVIASQQVSDQRSEQAAAQRRLTLARTTYERERTLWQDKISAEQDFLQARQAVEEAEIAVNNARQKSSVLSGSMVASGGNRYELRAPFDGVVLEKHLTPGEVVDETTAAFTLSDLSRVWVTFGVSPKDLDKVRVGNSVTVSNQELSAEVAGTVAYVGSLLGAQNRSATVRVTLENPQGAWRPGLYVNARVATDSREVEVAVPHAAIQTVEGQPTVFVRTDDGFRAQPVELGSRAAGQVEVTRGLQAGAPVASVGSFILKSELGKASAEHAH